MKALRVDNSRASIAMMEANLLPEGAATSKFGAYVSTLKKARSRYLLHWYPYAPVREVDAVP